MTGSQLDIYDALGVPAPLVERPDPLQTLAGAWLASYDSEHTRRAYGRDLRAWLAYCSECGLDPMNVRRAHVDVWARLGAGLASPAPTTLARRLSAVSAFYAYAVTEDLLGANPVAHVRRPKFDRDESNTRGLTRDEAKVMRLAASERMTLRDRIWIDLGLLLGLRRSGARGLDVADLGWDKGHRTITYTAKGGTRRTAPLPPQLVDAIDRYLGGRTDGPLLQTNAGRRVSTSTLFRAVQRCARLAGLDDPDTVTPHSLRHTFVTLALENGVPLEVVQDAAGHADPRLTQRYNRSRDRLDRHPAYLLGTQLS